MSPPPEAPWRAGLKIARSNLVPGLILQAVALTLVVAYYRDPSMRAALDHLTGWRRQFGVVFAMVTTGFFGGFLPVLYSKARRSSRSHYTWAQAAVLTAFWTYKGFEVDLFYRTLARIFGEGHDVGTIALKTVADQVFYCPLFAVPVSALVYEWVQCHFDTRHVVADMRSGTWMQRRLLPVLISNVGVWLPAVCIIYALPTALQLPLQNLVLCFFTLVIAEQTRRTL